MTEDEAKTKWCVHARAGLRRTTLDQSGFVTPNVWNDGDGEKRTHCIASACMAWRHSGEGGGSRETYRDADGKPCDRTFAYEIINEWVPPSALHGYCGLAGKP